MIAIVLQNNIYNNKLFTKLDQYVVNFGIGIVNKSIVSTHKHP